MNAEPNFRVASPEQTVDTIAADMARAGCRVRRTSPRLTVSEGDRLTVRPWAVATAAADADLLDVWRDLTPNQEDAAIRRHSLLAALGDQLLLHRVAVEGTEPLPSIADLLPAALPYEADVMTPAGHRSSSDRHPDAPGATTGDGVFTIPFGPVRSGVVEAMLYEIDTAGEDMLLVRPRFGYKQRGLEARLCSVPLDHVPLVAERIAGMYSVAGAVAVCQAIEDLAGVEPSAEACAVRLILAELERVYNHCDSILKLTDDASLVIGTAQVGILKERVLRLMAQLTGHRYARGIVTIGGVRRGLASIDLREELRRFGADSSRVRRLLLRTDSFLDRLERTGHVPTAIAAALGTSGPVARGSHVPRDVRAQRPSGAYKGAGLQPAVMSDCDAMARTEVRMAEIQGSLRLIVEILKENGTGLSAHPAATLSLPSNALGVGCVESPEGEWVAVVETGPHGELVMARVRPASIANFACFQRACEGWVLTDFAFIEHSFGLSVAGRDR